MTSTPAGLTPGGALELPKLLQRVDPHVRVGADREPDSAVEQLLERREAVAEVRLGRRAQAHGRSRVREQVELRRARMRGVDDRRRRAEAAAPREQLDRAARRARRGTPRSRAVARTRARGGRDSSRCRVAPDLGQPRGRAGTHGVGGEADAGAALPEPLDLPEVVVDRRLPESLEAAALVRGEQEHELEPGRSAASTAANASASAEVVELADGGVPGGAHLAVRPRVRHADEVRRLARGLREHRFAPRPEVATGTPPAQRALEGVRVRCDERRAGSRDRQPLGTDCHARSRRAQRS